MTGRGAGIGGAVRRRYGASPAHLVLVLCSFAVTLYAGVRLLGDHAVAVVLWFAAAVVLHDLVLLPLYALVDRVVRRLLGAAGAVRWIGHIRVPAVLSGLLLLVWAPLILGRSADRYEAATGLAAEVFWQRWLIATAALFAASALVLAVRAVRTRRPPEAPGAAPHRRRGRAGGD